MNNLLQEREAVDDSWALARVFFTHLFSLMRSGFMVLRPILTMPVSSQIEKLKFEMRRMCLKFVFDEPLKEIFLFIDVVHVDTNI